MSRKKVIKTFSRLKIKLLIVAIFSVTTVTILGTVHAATMTHSAPQTKPLPPPTKMQTKTTQQVSQKPQAEKEASAPSAPLQSSASPSPSSSPAPSISPSSSTTKNTAPAKATATVQPQLSVTAAQDIAPDSACPGQNDTSSYQSTLVCMTSYVRTAHGLSTVSGVNSLAVSAGKKAQDLIDCGFSHTACGRSFTYWMAPSGYSCGTTAENIAAGQPTPHSVFVAWMNSAGHRANILNGSYKSIGLGLQTNASAEYGTYWVMQLGAC